MIVSNFLLTVAEVKRRRKLGLGSRERPAAYSCDENPVKFPRDIPKSRLPSTSQPLDHATDDQHVADENALTSPRALQMLAAECAQTRGLIMPNERLHGKRKRSTSAPKCRLP